MSLRKLKNFIIAIFAVLICFATITPQPALADNLEQKKQQTREKIRKIQILEGLERNKLYKNQQKLENTHSTLANSKTRYNQIQLQLSKMETELMKSQIAFNSADALLKNRIRQVFKTQRLGMFELILAAKDLNALLDVVYFERIIIKQDYEKMVKLKEQSDKLAKMKKDIELQKQSLAQTIANMNWQQKSIKQAIAQNQSMINKLKTDKSYYQKAERELEQQSKNIQKMITKGTTQTSTRTASGSFLKPIGGRITSPFGWRTHPIFNSRTFHSGIDIGGPNGGNILASNSGKVIYSGWYGGYGKVVIIDHGTVNGKPTTTLYAHMSTIKVNQGQSVSKGQVIGLEGTTGYSTGPHCHFEVRINGKPDDPSKFI
ncbi:peptidoglycan DD-metalloendopeptidase family protein [bacterium]|nr:peptidoglycan DD-metalloendopeptidase family protein [bacterium]